MIIESLWFILPAYAANSFPVLINGKKPLDLKKNFFGKRILGDGKTIEGSIAGILFGIFVGWIQLIFQNDIMFYLGFDLVKLSFPLVVLLSIGAIFGDIVGSFIKRRLNISRGEPAILLDQVDFLIFALLLAGIVYVPYLITIILLFIATPIIHMLSNILAYFTKAKRNPW